MEAFLLTPDHETRSVRVESVSVPDDPERSVYRRIAELLEVDLVQRIPPHSMELLGHASYVDEDGLSDDLPGYIWAPVLYPLPLGGRVLVLGDLYHPMDGYIPASAMISMDALKALVADSYASNDVARVAHNAAAKATLDAGPPGTIVLNPFKG